MATKKKELTPEEIAALKASMEAADLDFANAKLAYYNRTEYKGETITYDALKAYAEDFIGKNHAVQKAVFGKVHVRLQVANLMRE
jgi:tyrosyl-tRNA synthetase